MSKSYKEIVFDLLENHFRRKDWSQVPEATCVNALKYPGKNINHVKVAEEIKSVEQYQPWALDLISKLRAYEMIRVILSKDSPGIENVIKKKENEIICMLVKTSLMWPKYVSSPQELEIWINEQLRNLKIGTAFFYNNMERTIYEYNDSIIKNLETLDNLRQEQEEKNKRIECITECVVIPDSS
jgi:hypothetical protein